MKKIAIFLVLNLALTYSVSGHAWGTRKAISAGGVKKVSVRVPTNAKGMSVEQVNVGKRVARDNKPGAMKHLYIISAYSGDVIIYSPVVAKVTSSGKRLSPVTVVGGGGTRATNGMPVNIAGETYYSEELLQDDGTYGSSIPYIFWFDANDAYHQHYVTGGQIIHLSDVPMSFPKVIINLDTGK